MLRRTLFALTFAAGLLVANPPAAHAATYSAPLMRPPSLTSSSRARSGPATTATCSRTGSDTNGDGCHTRNEVLIAEADDPVTVGSGCSLSGGQLVLLLRPLSWTNPSDVDIDHMVPLAEAWDSGARTWTTSVRQSFANDLGDFRTLVGVTDNVNQEKGDQDPREWMRPTTSAATSANGWR